MEFIFNHEDQWYGYNDFPPHRFADEDGLLAFGGEYSAECFEHAYRKGIFPWPSEDVPNTIPWFSPRERFVLYTSEFHASHSLRRTLKHHPFEIKADQNFREVIHHCASVSRNDAGTWITPEMESTFCELHKKGLAHSIESYLDGELVGGFYGTCIGKVFGGESMFFLKPDATKIALAIFMKRAAKYGMPLIDCQCYTDNMARFGARLIPRRDFLETLGEYGELTLPEEFWAGNWSKDGG